MFKEGSPRNIPITESQTVLRGKPPFDTAIPLIDQALTIAPVKVGEGERRFSGVAAGIVRLVPSKAGNYTLHKLADATYGKHDDAQLTALRSFLTGINLQLEREDIQIARDMLPNGKERIFWKRKQQVQAEEIFQVPTFIRKNTPEIQNLLLSNMGGMSTTQINAAINEVIDDIRAEYPDISLLPFYREIASRVTRYVSGRVQEESLQAITSIDPKQRNAGMNALLFTNLHKILAAAEPYFGESDEYNEEIIQEAIASATEALIDFKVDSGIPIATTVNNMTRLGLADIISDETGIPTRAILAKAHTEVLERAEEYAMGYEMTQEELDDLSSRSSLSVSVLQDYFEGYKTIKNGMHTDIEWEDTVGEKAARSFLREPLSFYLDKLSVNSKSVIEQHFGLNYQKERTFSEIAKDMYLSQERVRQIEKVALIRLQVMERHERRLRGKKEMPYIAKNSPYYNHPIEELNLELNMHFISSRVATWWTQKGIKTMGQLSEISYAELSDALGPASATIIKTKLDQFVRQEYHIRKS